MKNIEAIILAAGRGTRMNAQDLPDSKAGLPKVLYQLGRRPILSYILGTLTKTGIYSPIIVVGFRAEKVKEEIGPFYRYALQKNPLGTASAVAAAKDLVSTKSKALLVLNGDDSAFYKPSNLKNLILTHLKNMADLTLLSVKKEDPKGLGRIVRDQKGKILKIVEEKVATEKQKKITEVNTGCYVFNPKFLWQALSKIKKSKAGEYYLTDIVEIANLKKQKVQVMQLEDPSEWVGINTPEELALAEKQISRLI